jgi:putative SOS response-associated peptidase YedK
MCGRYVIKSPSAKLKVRFQLDDLPLFEPRYNIAPTQPVPIVRRLDQPKREWTPVRWGLIPSWAKDAKIGNKLINARGETVAEKPSFRSAFRKRRCLIPADGFYEWKKLDGGKQPHFIHLCDEEPFAFAGLWELWTNPNDGEVIESCTIVTTEANALMRTLHDRMPVIVPAEDYDLWLDAATQDVEGLKGLLRPYPSDDMTAYPISAYVNNPRHEGVKCVEPAGS